MGLGRAEGTQLCQGRLVVVVVPTHAQGEAVEAVEGAVAVVADRVPGARLCLALTYVWLSWHRLGRGWRGHGGGSSGLGEAGT